MTARAGSNGQFIDMGKAIPVCTDDYMPHRLIIQISHENRAVRRPDETGKFIRVYAVTLAIGRDHIQRPVLDLLVTVSTGIRVYFKTKIIAPYIRRKPFIRQSNRNHGVIGV